MGNYSRSNATSICIWLSSLLMVLIRPSLLTWGQVTFSSLLDRWKNPASRAALWLSLISQQLFEEVRIRTQSSDSIYGLTPKTVAQCLEKVLEPHTRQHETQILSPYWHCHVSHVKYLLKKMCQTLSQTGDVTEWTDRTAQCSMAGVGILWPSEWFLLF
jgi:hypothetical protein